MYSCDYTPAHTHTDAVGLGPGFVGTEISKALTDPARPPDPVGIPSSTDSISRVLNRQLPPPSSKRAAQEKVVFNERRSGGLKLSPLTAAAADSLQRLLLSKRPSSPPHLSLVHTCNYPAVSPSRGLDAASAGRRLNASSRAPFQGSEIEPGNLSPAFYWRAEFEELTGKLQMFWRTQTG